VDKGTGPRWARDGKRIAYARADGIWTYDLTDGQRTQWTGSGTDPIWSPRGKSLLFRNGGVVKQILFAGPQMRKLVPMDGAPRWVDETHFPLDVHEITAENLKAHGMGEENLENDQILAHRYGGPHDGALERRRPRRLRGPVPAEVIAIQVTTSRRAGRGVLAQRHYLRALESAGGRLLRWNLSPAALQDPRRLADLPAGRTR
jgi:hypothetical protein